MSISPMAEVRREVCGDGQQSVKRVFSIPAQFWSVMVDIDQMAEFNGENAQSFRDR